MASQFCDVANSTAMYSFDDRAEERLTSIRDLCERAHLFCDVLAVLAEDLFQIGREAIALSLLEYADGELSRILRWEEPEFEAVVAREGTWSAHTVALGDELAARRRELTPMMGLVIVGLDHVSNARLPPDPVEFVIDVTRFIGMLKGHLRWMERLLQPAESIGIGVGGSELRRETPQE